MAKVTLGNRISIPISAYQRLSASPLKGAICHCVTLAEVILGLDSPVEVMETGAERPLAVQVMVVFSFVWNRRIKLGKNGLFEGELRRLMINCDEIW